MLRLMLPSGLALFTLLGACEGMIDEVDGIDGLAPVPELLPENIADDVGSSDFRRLSRRELAHSIELIVGFRPDAADTIPYGSVNGGFNRVDNEYSTTNGHIQAYAAIADEIADRWVDQGIDGLSACESPASEVADAATCRDAIIERFAGVTLRRTVIADDRTRLQERYAAGETHDDGLRALAHALFRNPEFLYVIELPELTADAEPEELSAFELATRLSLAFCERTPDAPLLALAEDGSLIEPETLRAEALRLLEECGEGTIEDFVGQWLGFEETPLMSPSDRGDMPAFTQSFIDGIDAEWRAYVRAVVFEDKGSFADFLSADYTVADERLAAVYDSAELGSTAARIALPEHRRGVLNLPAFLAMHHHHDATHPIDRGVHLLRRLGCWSVRAPDMVSFPPNDPALTGRDRWDEHTLKEDCRGCHATINPAGFSFEDFDSMGRHRTEEENGQPINATGSVPIFDIDAVDGGASLSEALADSPHVAQCVAAQWFRYSLGRSETRLDASSVKHIAEHLGDEASMQEGLASLATSYAFRHRRPTSSEE